MAAFNSLHTQTLNSFLFQRKLYEKVLTIKTISIYKDFKSSVLDRIINNNYFSCILCIMLVTLETKKVIV